MRRSPAPSSTPLSTEGRRDASATGFAPGQPSSLLPASDPVLGPVPEGFEDKPPSLPVPARTDCLHFQFLSRRSSKPSCLHCLIQSLSGSRTNHCLVLFLSGSRTNHCLFLFPSVRGVKTHSLQSLCPGSPAVDLQSPTAGLTGSTAGFLVANILIGSSEGPLHIWAGLPTSFVVGALGSAASIQTACYSATGLHTACAFVADFLDIISAFVADRLNSARDVLLVVLLNSVF
ncbi:hypothetical protein CRENBAI_023317 [Crenichthys baileyi]|uniref:SLC26A/SulP transporter domain-containing protein n=1 Tax=Crenichthys baileyi TaxID=28760 RepID=A0AAV9R873_9TELE